MQIGIIGTGYIANRHAAVLKEMEDVDIVAHLDVTMEPAQRAADTWGGTAYTSLEKMLQDNALDAVWMCVPPFAHGDIEASLLDRNIPMYIEKPVGVDMEIPSRIARRVEKSKGALVTVGYYWRCMAIMPKLKHMLSETPPQLIRIAYHGPTAPAPWWRVRTKSGGQVVEQATHLIDTARFLLGEATVQQAASAHHPRAEYPGTDIATSTAALLKFDSGLFGTFSAACVLDTFVDTAIEFICEGRKITLSLRELRIDTADGTEVLETGPDPLLLADQAFIAAVRSKDPAALPCPYGEALRTQQLCYDIQAMADKDVRHDQ